MLKGRILIVHLSTRKHRDETLVAHLHLMCVNTISTFDQPNAMVHLVFPSPFKYCHLPWSTSNSLYPIFHKWLYCGERLAPSLIWQVNQLQLNGITISDGQKQFDQNFKHSIDVPVKDFAIHFKMRRVFSFFDSH
jgi:hypothetical protein